MPRTLSRIIGNLYASDHSGSGCHWAMPGRTGPRLALKARPGPSHRTTSRARRRAQSESPGRATGPAGQAARLETADDLSPARQRGRLANHLNNNTGSGGTACDVRPTRIKRTVD